MMIPKIIHFCWLSGEPYPPLIEHCINSWREKLPGYQFVLWDKAKADGIASEWVQEICVCCGLYPVLCAVSFRRNIP